MFGLCKPAVQLCISGEMCECIVARHFHFNSSFVRSFVLCIHVQMQENVVVVVVVVTVVELVKSFFSCYYCCFQWTTISCYKQWIRLRMFVGSIRTERLKRWRKEKQKRRVRETSLPSSITSTQIVINTDGDFLHRPLMPSNNMNRIYKRIQI